MTGQEILTLAQDHFAEASGVTNPSIPQARWERFLNAALFALWHVLPPEELRELYTEASVAVDADGAGDLPSSLEQVIDVFGPGEARLHEVPAQVIAVVDQSTYNVPDAEVYAVSANQLLVRPKPAASTSYTVVHVAKPTEIANFANEVTALNDDWHPTLANIVASWAYAQEEDLEQANYYRGLAEREAGAPLPKQSEAA